ncbi:transmembrane protein, putative [Medicago truncatula]|uniref:Transmembrane protein, putative n=1 Tax=Medicago truncatula TaxID=3880 RepID=A0A072VIL8_MEDTR|nr:transmembrane protein, putative [Medicago truncatula]
MLPKSSISRTDFDLVAYMFFSFFLYYYMFSELTPSLFVLAGLALRLRNRSYIGYESWSQGVTLVASEQGVCIRDKLDLRCS